jgi:4-hydroxybenzoate polyprenyltransferase
MKKKKKKITAQMVDLFFLTRPVVIVPVWGFCAFGAHAVNKNLFMFLKPAQYVLILLYSLSAASVYVINQIADYDVDKSNAGFPLLVRGNIHVKTAWITAVICALASIAGLLLLGSPAIALLSLIAIIAGCIYSCKPFSLSGRPFFDFLTNAFEAFLAFAAGWCVMGGKLIDPLLYQYAIPYLLLMCAGSISSTIPDIPGDRAHGKITTAVRFGSKNAHCIGLGCLVTSIPISYYLTSDYLALSCAALVIPIYILYLFSNDALNLELTYKVGGAITMAASALVVPKLFPAGIFVFFITWLYFRIRHNITYPSLAPAGTKR